jgi:aryl-alcohol dehydrogenase-like predicted oxidoreductase
LSLPRRLLGKTGLSVSVLGLGAGSLGRAELDDAQVERCLREAVDLTITLFDTARSYGMAEERLGRFLAPVRGDVVLSTKGGYGVDGTVDWTGPCVAQGVDRALKALRTDWIDVFHLHSCPLDIAQRDDILRALENALAQGKIRVAGYSGEGDALAWAVDSGHFGVVQCSLNIVDQVNEPILLRAIERGVGVIAKRPLANAVWRLTTRPDAADTGEYWSRFDALHLDSQGLEWAELALRFSTYATGVTAAIAGTASPESIRRNVAALAKGPLGADLASRIHLRFEEVGRAWRAVV